MWGTLVVERGGVLVDNDFSKLRGWRAAPARRSRGAEGEWRRPDNHPRSRLNGRSRTPGRPASYVVTGAPGAPNRRPPRIGRAGSREPFVTLAAADHHPAAESSVQRRSEAWPAR
jgi:hypothetical protein